MKQALRDALDDRGYDTLTPVQEAVLDPDLEGRDLLVSAQTGSGKTLGFGLAIAPTLLEELEAFAPAGIPLGLVIAPTRELALQVKRELAWLFAKAGAQLASCVGGMDMRDERRALARGAHIVVATPGRLRDHIMRGSIDLSGLRAVVLDEADEMLDLGFREDLEFILGEAPTTRQTLLFSATVPKSIAGLAKSYQRDAVRVVTKSEAAQHADISYRAMTVADRDAENAVINTLLYYQAPNSIVFGNTRAMVNRLTTRLSNRGLQVVSLSGELSQSERTHALQAMRDGRARICVATDVAARGIDLPNLDLVVHAELPSNHETLLHRSGRTGRAGRKGVSALIVTKKTRKKAERILSMAKLKADWSDAPTAEEVYAREEERMFAGEAWQVPAEGSEQETVDKLTATFTDAQLATAFLRLYRSARSTPEELSGIDAKPEPRPEFGPSVWFSITGGRDAGAEPRRILPMLLKIGSLEKDDIGAIRVRQDHSFVQVREASVPGLLAAIGADMMVEPGARLTRLDAPPTLGGDKARKPLPPAKSAAPVDWNDDPAPRKRKPKPQDRPKTPKSAPLQSKDKQPSEAADPAVLKARKPRTKPKGPPPPKGKPSSKKNRVRAQAAKGRGAGKPGGFAKPKRPKSGS
ncbi:MAG: DEAD/DEAH box helicase [Sulfitobacter sp.]|nr:DEAD/DEAH box helicase [Sulfitobacter sp.]